jgi:hypothetical protein
MKTIDEILEPVIVSYWESHQFENCLYEEGEYVKLEDVYAAMEEYAEQVLDDYVGKQYNEED